jgi:nitrite reductase/ring-hydroxylating ferredoxin subunit
MTRFCASEKLAAGAVLSRVVDGRPVAVARFTDGSLCAFIALCPHQQADLGFGILEDGGITCRDHLPSGRCTSIPGARLANYPVHEADGEVHVVLPDA